MSPPPRTPSMYDDDDEAPPAPAPTPTLCTAHSIAIADIRALLGDEPRPAQGVHGAGLLGTTAEILARLTAIEQRLERAQSTPPPHASDSRSIAYWVVVLVMAAGQALTGYQQITRAPVGPAPIGRIAP